MYVNKKKMQSELQTKKKMCEKLREAKDNFHS